MKAFIRFFLKKFFLLKLNTKFIRKLEQIFSLYQGKGWGSDSIEKEIESCLSLLNNKPKIFIDIGANKGLYTKTIISKIPNIKCHLFEPSAYNVDVLKKVFVKHKTVKINNFALSKINAQSNLYSNFTGSGYASLTKRRLDHFNEEMNIVDPIVVKRFDNYWKEKELIIDYVKADVEGHELDVLKGFGELIFNSRLIQFEFGGCNIDTKTYFQDFWYFFLDKDFIIYRITPRGPELISQYDEKDEYFVTTNYIALNKKYLGK